jgi:tetratricopeptide (TPR) repeat protein
VDNPLERLADALSDRYAIDRELGSGGMATVYLAEDLKHHRKVAVKVLRPELAAALGPERFLREIEIAASLTHPHILPLYDSGEAEGFLYYVMPYVEGESLRDRLNREKQLPVDDALQIARDVAEALDSAHRHDVIHRDIKPENILLEEGHAVVADFGIARAVDVAGGTKLTETGIALGTPHYMSPEQASGGQDVDGRSDLYSLGCVLYEMLGGEPPFTGATVESIVHQQIAVEPRPVTALRPAVPADVAAALSRVLSKAPADRFSPAAQFADALGTASITTSGVTPPVAAPRWQHPIKVAGLFGIGSLAVLALVYLLMLQLGLPDWVFVGAMALVVVGLPVTIATALVERQRATGSMPTPTSGSESVIHRWLTWRNALRGGGGAFVTLAVVTVAYMAMRTLGMGPVGTLMAKGVLAERDPILLADFANHTTDSILGHTVTEALRIDLSQSRAVRLVDPDLVMWTLGRMELEPTTPLDERLAREVAQREGVKAVVAGEIAPVGGGYVLSARLLSTADGTTLLGERAQAADERELLSAIDRLSGTLREGIGESLRDVRASPPLERVTTRSLEALRLYTMGNRAQMLEGNERALPLIEQALALDSTFAMAWRKAGTILGNLGRRTQSRAARTKAYELRDRVPLRERHHIEAAQHYDDPAKAIAPYEQLLQVYPDDADALNNLGVAYLWGEAQDFDRAVEYFRRSLEVNRTPFRFDNLAYALAWSGRLDEAEATTRLIAAEYPEYGGGEAGLENFLGLLSFLRADFEGALSHWQSASVLLPNRSIKANAQMRTHWLLAMQGRLAEAASSFEQAQQIRADDHPPDYVSEAAWEGLLDVVVRNERERGLRRVEAALRRSPLDSLPALDRPYLELARFYAEVDRLDRAKVLVERFVNDPALPETERTARQRNWEYRWTLGAVALREGRLEDAVGELVRASELSGMRSPCIGPLADLGIAHERAGQGDSAIAVYQRFLASFRFYHSEFRPSCRAPPDAVGRAAILKRLGELYEERGEGERAAEYYSQFVDLWRDADEELQPQVREIRQRVARLVGEP